MWNWILFIVLVVWILDSEDDLAAQRRRRLRLIKPS
jgi:hypothetical protein